MSVKKHNEFRETPIAPEKLKSDVDFAYQKLQSYHPNLYWYISKEKLDYKFDSLKATINQPIAPKDFFWKLAPVIAEVRQGHLRILPMQKRLTQKEINGLKKQKGLLSPFNYVVEGQRIFVKDNPDKIAGMNVGTEILKIDGIPVRDLLEKYRPLISSDGFNTTFHPYILAKRFSSYVAADFGILDSVKLETKHLNEYRSFYLSRKKISKEEQKKEEVDVKKIVKSEKGKVKDYNIVTKSFNRDLQFPTKDSAVAYLKIKTFSGVYSRKFYQQSFSQLKKSPAKYLIIDIRDNLGGSLSEVNNLYSYLVSEKFTFINDIKITKRSSVFKADYFSLFPWYSKPLAVIGFPFYSAAMYFSTKKKAGEFYLRNNNAFAVKKPKKNHFDGTIYVIINGSSFSASSLLSAKLKADKRAFLVGEETGGANDGTVAGRYNTEKLPYSKLYFPIGLMLIQPHIDFTKTKKGVLPDHAIVPNFVEVLIKKDVELDWIMKDIKEKETKN